MVSINLNQSRIVLTASLPELNPTFRMFRRFITTNATALTKEHVNKGATAEGMSYALSSLRSSYPNLYARIHLHNMPFTVRPRDYIWTHRMKDTTPGDIIILDRIRELGSKEATLRGRPWIKDKRVLITATVLEHSRGTKVKVPEHRQRKGRRPKLTIKPHTTLLRIRDVVIGE